MRDNSDGRIRSLDGIRAVAMLCVLADHISGTINFPFSHKVPETLALGYFGVRIFFVLSGFLITGILLREHQLTGRISLARFYFRRTLRIFPPYYGFLLVLLVGGYLGWFSFMQYDLLAASTYTSSYRYPERSWWINHTWSLSVEEQFYLIWPATLLFLGISRGMAVVAGTVVLLPVVRLMIYLSGVTYPIGGTFETVADALATGCLLAGMRDWLWSKPLYRKLLVSRWFVLVPLVVLYAASLHGRPRISYFLCYTVMNVGIALTLDWSIRFSHGLIGRFLNSAVMVQLGVMSYSFYLYQQLFLHPESPAFSARFPQNILFAFIAASLAYYLVERQSLLLRSRLETWWTARSMKRSTAAVEEAELPETEAALGSR